MLVSLKFYQGIPPDTTTLLLKLLNDHYDIRTSLNGAIIDLSHIVSSFHIEVACAQAILKFKSKKMKTKCLWDEIQYSASGTSRIDEAFKTFQITSDSNLISVIRVDRNSLKSNNDTENQLVDGDNIDSFMMEINNLLQNYEISIETFNETKTNLISFCDKDFMAFMIKQFKLNSVEIETFGMVNAVITRIATKDVL